MTGMKRVSIAHVIRKKVDNWLATITDEKVRELAARDTIVTGGCIASMLLGENVNDYDIYFKTRETTLAVAKYYVAKYNRMNVTKTKVRDYKPVVKETTITNCLGQEENRIVIWMQSSGVAAEMPVEEYRYFEFGNEESTEAFVQDVVDSKEGNKKKAKKTEYRPIFLSDNAITLSDRVQLMIRFYGSPTEIHGNYDFVHAMNYYEHDKKQVTLHPEALESLLSKSLVYRGSLYPLCSIFRTRKFIERGWRITAGQMLKMAYQVNQLKLNDYNVLREQLLGCDAAYMYELLQKLRSADPNTIDSAYISKIVDECFD
jgi:hypothetical protein